MDGCQLRLWKDRRNRPPPVLRDQLGIVAAAVANVESPHLAFGNSAATTEESMGHCQYVGAKDVDLAHTQARMMMSSSAWLPTMNLYGPTAWKP